MSKKKKDKFLNKKDILKMFIVFICVFILTYVGFYLGNKYKDYSFNKTKENYLTYLKEKYNKEFKYSKYYVDYYDREDGEVDSIKVYEFLDESGLKANVGKLNDGTIVDDYQSKIYNKDVNDYIYNLISESLNIELLNFNVDITSYTKNWYAKDENDYQNAEEFFKDGGCYLVYFELNDKEYEKISNKDVFQVLPSENCKGSIDVNIGNYNDSSNIYKLSSYSKGKEYFHAEYN